MGKKMQDLTGMKFGDLTVLGMAHKDNVWHCMCKCSCGKEKMIRVLHLKSGATKSCGCRTRKDLTGMKFGELTAIKLSHRGNRQESFWECECSCGKRKVIRGADLTFGSSKSCGCRRHLCKRNIGRTVGNFKIIDYDVSLKKYKAECLLCGKVVLRSCYSFYLWGKKNNSCGCRIGKTEACRKASERQVVDMTGKKNGPLTIIERVEQKKGAVWRCKCKCGKITEKRGIFLRKSKYKHCSWDCGLWGKEKSIKND